MPSLIRTTPSRFPERDNLSYYSRSPALRPCQLGIYIITERPPPESSTGFKKRILVSEKHAFRISSHLLKQAANTGINSVGLCRLQEWWADERLGGGSYTRLPCETRWCEEVCTPRCRTGRGFWVESGGEGCSGRKRPLASFPT